MSIRHLPRSSNERILRRRLRLGTWNRISIMRHRSLRRRRRRRPGEHSYESAQEFLTAVGFFYLRSAGRRRRGTILNTSAGAGTCNFSVSLLSCLLHFPLSLLSLFIEGNDVHKGQTKRKVGEEERRRPVFLVFHLRNLAISVS